MAFPTIAEYLKYADLQMAAEAFLVEANGEVKADIPRALGEGNNRSLLFTETQATAFAAQWEVLDQKDNTPTGFSGTLFRNQLKGSESIDFQASNDGERKGK